MTCCDGEVLRAVLLRNDYLGTFASVRTAWRGINEVLVRVDVRDSQGKWLDRVALADCCAQAGILLSAIGVDVAGGAMLIGMTEYAVMDVDAELGDVCWGHILMREDGTQDISIFNSSLAEIVRMRGVHGKALERVPNRLVENLDVEDWQPVVLPDSASSADYAPGGVVIVVVGTNSELINDLCMGFSTTKWAPRIDCNVMRVELTDSSDVNCDVLRSRFEEMWQQAEGGGADGDGDKVRRIVVFCGSDTDYGAGGSVVLLNEMTASLWCCDGGEGDTHVWVMTPGS